MEKRYFDLNSYFRSIYGVRVQKVTVDAGFTCPNRDGKLSYGGCIYCNPKGSGTGAHGKGLSVGDQIESGKERVKRRYKNSKFLAYFQSYSNTYAPVEHLKKLYDEALSVEDVVGLSIGTRPDCVDPEKISLLQSYTDKYLIWIEYGIQTIHDKSLTLINRGHDYKAFEKAVAITKNKGIKICAHIIIGIPGETRDDILETAKEMARLKIDGVKIHLLYVVKGTKLHEMYDNNEFECLTQNEYIELTCDFLELLPKETIIQRVTGDPHSDELVAPSWPLTTKSQTITKINQTLENRNSYQGKYCNL
ncbi:MAG: TIGR01212 family radical SAM protein [Desulfobacterales bacterium]|nr:TIGR01212 family radical SAM protein [Desulfobacterales bacterium]MCP4158641.1 TIGR01212 family radical SAM protein [Deltaproteobacteria bacterium]